MISEVTEKATAKRVELTEAMRKRRALEILKEQEHLRNRNEQQKRETAFLDEIASNQWMMKSR